MLKRVSTALPPAWGRSVARGQAGRARAFGAARGPTQAQLLAAMASKEVKFHDLDIDDAVVAIGGTVAQASCNLIAQGVGESQRVGRKCTLKSINWRFTCGVPEADGAATAANSDVIRVILYVDKQANKAAAAVTDIVESSDYQTFNNLGNKGRFYTLMDRTYDVNRLGGIGTPADQDWAEVFHTDTFFKDVSIPIEFTAATGAITEITSNNVGVLLLGKTGTGVFDSKMRVRFTDS